MIRELKDANQVLITISVICGSIALTLACVGIGTSNWQITLANTTDGETYISRTSNFFYACRFNSIGDILSCGERSSNSNILLYYNINGRGNQSELTLYLNTAAGFSIIGIIFILIGVLTTLLMFFADQAEWIFLIAPSFFFVACLFMLAGLAEGSRVLLYNGYSVHLYEAAHVFTIFSLLISAIVAGRLFNTPLESEKPKKIQRIK